MKKLLTFIILMCGSIVLSQDINNGGPTSVGISSPLDSDGNIPVSLQSRATKVLAVRAFQTTKFGMTLATNAVVDSYDLTYTAGHGLEVGDELAIIEEAGNRIYSIFGRILATNANVITMDSQAGYTFSSNVPTSFVSVDNMAIDGSVTQQVFSIPNITTKTIHLTRVIFHITDGTAMDDALFGGITALTRGVRLRKKYVDGTYDDYDATIRNNGEFGELAYDKIYDTKAPAGVFGLTVRLTFSGESKQGSVIQLLPGEQYQVIIQDDLTDLLTFVAMFEGHFLNTD